PDYTSTFIAILGKSVPSFVFATVLQYWLVAKLQIFPVAGWGTFADTILPAFALAMFPLATAARFMRTELIDVFASDYVLLAKAKGNSRTEVAV
ncbi:ABC transporter permease subunit, partial [Escherichia coli]|nr:ABC transporter permease subunit [Escherichia coli]